MENQSFPKILILVILGLITGCTNNSGDRDDIQDTLRVDIGNEVPTLDPALAEDGFSYRVVNDLFAGLIDFDQANRPIPGMASSWEISPDGKTYTFKLRNNLHFSDGSKITAKDFIYSWERLVDPKTGSPYSFLLKDVVNGANIIDNKMPASSLGISAPEPYTFIVNLDHPSNSFLAYLTVPNLYVVPEKIIKKYGSSWTDPKYIVSSGAYLLKEHIVNGYILSVKNPYFYDASLVKITRVKYFPYVDSNVSLSNYKIGALDTTWQNVPVDRYNELKTKYPKELHTYPWERLDFLNFNMKLPKYANNLKLRQALSMAIDREVLVKQVLKSGQVPLYSIVTPTIENGKYSDIKYNWSAWPRNKQIAEAKRLFVASGYGPKHPLVVSFKYRTSDLYRKSSIAIAAMWKEVLGIDVHLQNQEWKGLVQSLHKGDYEIAQGGWGADFNSVTTYIPLFQCGNGNNNAHYCNKKYDNLIAEAEKTVSAIEQEKIYKEAINKVLADYPVIPLFEPAHQRLVNLRVKNYHINENYLDNVQSKWFSLGN